MVWSESSSPTISINGGNDETYNSTDTGPFTAIITWLTPSTQYYVRAYATNSVGTAYGQEFTFTTMLATTPSPGEPFLTATIDGTLFSFTKDNATLTFTWIHGDTPNTFGEYFTSWQVFGQFPDGSFFRVFCGVDGKDVSVLPLGSYVQTDGNDYLGPIEAPVKQPTPWASALYRNLPVGIDYKTMVSNDASYKLVVTSSSSNHARGTFKFISNKDTSTAIVEMTGEFYVTK